MRRREFVGMLGGLVLASSSRAGTAHDKLPRIGVLDAQAETDSVVQAGDVGFGERLNELGWVAGSNIHIEYRWGAGNIDRVRLFAKELIQLNPDVLVAITTPATAALQAETHTIPIVFAQVSDPVGSGFVNSLAHPGGNITGFINIEASLSGKWLELHFTTTFVRSYAQEFEKLDRLRQQVDAGKITLRVAEVYPPERAADAHRRLEAGGTRGRLVIQFYT